MGLPWITRTVAGAVLEAGAIPPSTRFRGHAHEGVHLCGVLEGGFVEHRGASFEDAGPGTLRVSPSARHRLDFGPAGARCVVVQLDQSDAAVLGSLDRSSFLRDPWLAALVTRLGVVAQEEEPSPATSLHLEGVLAELLAQVVRRRGARAWRTPPSWLVAARERLHDEAGRPGLAELAGALGVHRAHLARAFRDHYGTTLGACARRLRTERAIRLIRGTDRPLAAIAAETGFADQSHMTRAVTSAFGTSPGRLRQARGPERATPVQDARPSNGRG